jgi:hypothetical protein
MPYFPMNTGIPTDHRSQDAAEERRSTTPPLKPPASIQAKNRRKRYLDTHPEYFSADLEMAGPRALLVLRSN